MSRKDDAEELESLEAALRIDKNSLDRVLISQPELFYKAGSGFIRAGVHKDDAKTALQTLNAELDIKFRNQAAQAGEKLTDTACGNRILATEAMQEAKGDLAAAQREADQWELLKEAFKQRSYVIKDLVALYTANYYATESAGKARSEAVTTVADKNRREAGELASKNAEKTGKRYERKSREDDD